MFDKNFYPTPKEIIKKMLEPYYSEGRHDWKSLSLYEKTILEPSAGKGDILDFIRKESEGRGPDTYCIENNPELRMVLAGKNYKVLADDFLNFNTEYSFDLIIMNPPFDTGTKHLLKAWNILVNGEIVCLLNSETYTNPHTKERQQLKDIIDTNGTVEPLGDCFSTAERRTGVDIVLVRLTKATETDEILNFDGMAAANLEFPEDLQNNKIAVTDVLLNYENRYRASIVAFKEMQKAAQYFKYLTKDVFVSNAYGEEGFESYAKMAMNGQLNSFIDSINGVAWEKVLSESNFQHFLTSKVRSEFTNNFAKQKNYQFTKENILILFDTLWQNRDKLMQDGIEGVFDTFTKYYKENRCHFEGWKTNDAWKVNRKIILPNYIKWDTDYLDKQYIRTHGAEFKVCYSRDQELYDIDRAMCYITGKKLEYIRTALDALDSHFTLLGDVRTGDKFSNKVTSSNFDIVFYKKGTIHLYFKDRFLWERFNVVATKAKNWIPPTTSNKKRDRHGTQMTI